MGSEEKQHIENSNILFFKVNFFYLIIREMLNCIVSGLYISANIMSMCCIDDMGVPIAGKKDNGKDDFKYFMKNYMGKANHKHEENEVQDKIWAIRCSLIHTFGNSRELRKLDKKHYRFFYGHDNYNEHLCIDEKNVFYLSDSKFVSDVISGVEEYFRKNQNYALLEKWYKKLIVISSMGDAFAKEKCIENEEIVYENIHEVLKILDYEPNIKINDLSNKINETILSINKPHTQMR